MLKRANRLIVVTAWFFAGAFILSACASEQLKQIEQDVDVLGAEIDAVPSTSSGIIGWTELLEKAERRGADFMQIKLDAARRKVALDARKQGRNPKVSAVYRARLSAASATGTLTSASSIGLGLDYDLANALLGLDKESIALTEELIGVQQALAEKQATIALLESYFGHLSVDLDLQEARLARRERQCSRDALETEVALGNAAPDALARFSERAGDDRRAARIFEQEKRIAADRVLAKAGFQPGGALSSSVAGTPKGRGNYHTQKCYSASGAERRDELLLGLAQQALKLAKLSRFTKVSALLPTQLDPARGLDLDVLINWVVPLIDQGETKRTIVNARLDLLSVSLTAKSERIRTQELFSRARSDMATQQLRMSKASNELALRNTAENQTRTEQCRNSVATRRSEIEVKRAELALRLANARLAILCN